MPEDGPKPRRRFFPRFSLRTLLILVLLAASGFGLWWKWDPWTIVQRLSGHSDRISNAYWSRDGALMLTYSSSSETFGSLKSETVAWDAHTGARLARIALGENADTSGADYAYFSDDGHWVCAGYGHHNRHQMVWDARTGEPLPPDSFEDPPKDVRFSPDRTRVLVVYGDRAPELWGAAKRERIFVFQGIGNSIDESVFSPDGSRLAFSHWAKGNPAVSVFDTTTGACLQTLDLPLKSPMTFTPDSRGLVAALDKPLDAFLNTEIDRALEADSGLTNQRTCLVNLDTGKAVRVIGDNLFFIPNLPGGKNLLTVGEKNSAVYDAATLELRAVLLGLPILLATTSADGNRILTMAPELSSWNEEGISLPHRPQSRVWFSEWDIGANREACRVELPLEPNETVRIAHFEQQDRRIVLYTSEKTVAWDAGSGSNLVTLRGDGIGALNGRQVLSWKKDADLRIGDTDHGEIMAELKGTSAGTAPKGAFSPSGDRLLLVPGGSAEEAQLWERRRDESEWGILMLPECWLTAAFTLLLVWSLVRDFRTLRRAPA